MDSMYLSIVILCIAFFILLGYLFFLIKRDGLKATTIKLIVQAEEMLGSGTGKAKMEIVVESLTKLLPMPFRLFVTTELLTQFIQSVFDEIKIALDYREKEANNG